MTLSTARARLSEEQKDESKVVGGCGLQHSEEFSAKPETLFLREYIKKDKRSTKTKEQVSPRDPFTVILLRPPHDPQNILFPGIPPESPIYGDTHLETVFSSDLTLSD